ncbi:cysteine peptidase family C39 domain-containing protein [Meiothermus rufus]|uniref:cysteine peptidase family C39 domain-containing protein n=1 Tax=Meiothermus rufus TaxID=604332 RepID=UPI0012EBA997|nr:cysteine peptidase family C39 domain-containing protein [Meiothermus rufus]
MALALRAMGVGEEEARPKGLTALALLRAMEALGLPARGFRVGLGGLRDYFARGGLPLILHTTRPEPHYVVGVGVVGDQVVLDDPSWGRRLLPLQGLIPRKGFGGAVLVPIPSPELIPRVRARQGAVLAWAGGRLERLEGLRRWP